MKSLREIVNQSVSIEEKIIDSGGVLTPEIEAILADIDLSLPQKVDNYNLIINRMENAAEFYRQQADFYNKFADACLQVPKRLKENIKYAMKTLKKDEILGVDVRFKLRSNNPSVFVTDENKIPKKFWVEKTDMVLDKKSLLNDLKITSIDGAELVQSQSVMVYPNKK